MRIETVNRKRIGSGSRLDSTYYLSDGAIASRIVDSYVDNNEYFLLSNKSIADIWQPNRSTITYAGEGEDFVSYLQPYDILEYLPHERARVSSHQNDINALKIKAGTILQTCSGRNLGPLVIADKYLEKFVFGSDLIRISISDNVLRNYIFTFFSTWIGQALLHSSKTGSVIDHLSVKDIERIKIPKIDSATMQEISCLIDDYYVATSTARNHLCSLEEKYNSSINISRKDTKLAKGWTCMSSSIRGNMRIDAAYYDPATIAAVETLKTAGGVKLSTVADVIKPAGRYKMNYVTKGHGTPLISGRQLLQNHIVSMKYLPFSSSDTYSRFALHSQWVAYPADGRVEGRLGNPVCITNARDGWFASGHIGRVIAKDGVSPGYIYLAMAHPLVQAQIHSLACGSVVDSVYPEDMKDVYIPPCIDFNYDDVVSTWGNFDNADHAKEAACQILTSLLEKNRD